MFDRQRFRAALVLKGLTMGELAQRLGINPSTLTKKVSGDSDFSRVELMKIREILDLTLEQFDSIFFAA